MGCVASKKAAPVTPALDSSGILWDPQASGEILAPTSAWNPSRSESGESGKVSTGSGVSSWSFRLGNISRYVEGEQAAAGWPAWLSTVAGEAIQGWVPLQADSFQKLEKIGQGTYSSVFRARDIETGKIVALKKVRFDNFEPESVRFMAREIQILRRLNHPNVVKLEGLITSHLSCSIYLVFEYMEHDLAGLSSDPDVKFSESQVKCYMHQLLSGLEHCHSHGIMHRDIKCANVLVNNEGIVKIADFGLANFTRPECEQPLTSRVVTLWYRPPELLLGSTDYAATVDLWSVGCVFAEMVLGKPILQGRTEVEQIHKIFKLCGSPSDEYWKKSKLPHATVFKPQHPYESCLRETVNCVTESAISLLETFLSVEPYKRGTASKALSSEYFKTKPYACEPSSLPKYPPNKEIDAKGRDTQRKSIPDKLQKCEATVRPSRTSRASRDSNGSSRLGAHPEDLRIRSQRDGGNGVKLDHPRVHGDNRLLVDHLQPARAMDPPRKNLNSSVSFHGDPSLDVSASSGFAWAKKQKDRAYARSISGYISKGNVSAALDPISILHAKIASNLDGKENGNAAREAHVKSKCRKSHGTAKRAMQKQWTQVVHRDSFNFSNNYGAKELSDAHSKMDAISSNRSLLGYRDKKEKFEYSGSLLSQSCKIDELLERHEHHVRQAARRSWFQRGMKHEA